MNNEILAWTRQDWQSLLFLFHVCCMVYITIRENWTVLISPGPIASLKFLQDLIINFINPFTIAVAAILIYRDLFIHLWAIIKLVFINPVRWLFRIFRKSRQPKQALVILCFTIVAGNSRAQISPTEVINIINSLSSGLNQLEIFASMDESLKTLEEAQNTMKSLKTAGDWFGKMEHAGTMLMLAEKVSCNAQNLNHVYTMYLGSDWKNWSQGKECLISYDYQLILLKAQTISDIIRELITSDDMDPGQRDMLSLQLQETMDKMNKAINDMHQEIKGQQEYADWLSYREKNISLASDITIERYQGTGEIARELVGNDAKSIFSTIIILCLAAGLPAVIYASATGSQNATQMMIAWLVALVLYTITNQIVN